MIRKIQTAALWGLDGFPVTVECYAGPGLPQVEIIGLPDTAVKESLDRIHAAAMSLELPMPRGHVTVNLAPADRKKQGSGFDLPILLSELATTVLAGLDLSDAFFVGELGLDGTLRGEGGALCLALAARDAGAKRLFVPRENAAECSVVDGLTVYGAENVMELLEHLTGEKVLSPTVFDRAAVWENTRPAVDFSDIKGQALAKRAAEIAAAGGHNLLLAGPPGSGKSMLAKAIPGILPRMTFEEMLESTKIHSIAGFLREGESLIRERPFRSPHHTMSFVGLAGGGAVPQPGEISLAHNGVLFLDELPEFEKRSLEVLRQPLEDRAVTITRAAWKLTFPADFMLVCAMNPCPCGYYGSDQKKCTCSPQAIERYLGKISGPLLDRIDIRIEVPALSFDELNARGAGETSEAVRERVDAARKLARERYRDYGVRCNGALSGALTKKFCRCDNSAEEVLKSSFVSRHMSARGLDRVLRLSRTIADLAGDEIISEKHVLEAVQFRFSSEKFFNR